MSRITNYIKRKLMSFRNIFKDENDINEKSVVGFAAFMVMVVFAASRYYYRNFRQTFRNSGIHLQFIRHNRTR